MHHDRHRSAGHGLGLVGSVFAAGLATVALVALGREFAGRREMRPPDDAGERAHGDAGDWRESTVVGRSVTIAKPRRDLYAFWRDFKNLASFMENVDQVAVVDERKSRWTIRAPGETDVEFISTIIEDRPGEEIAWESEEGAAIRNSGRVSFKDAPANRGTIVDLTIAYDPPGGAVGQLIAKMFQREPHMQARRDLKRFKQLMETGEIATAAQTNHQQRGAA
jgi:uncharacterized membrane protein